MKVIKYAKKEDIPQGLAEYCKEVDGQFVLTLGGDDAGDKGGDDKSKIAEFRETNLSLLKELKELRERQAAIEEKYKDVDLESYNAVRADIESKYAKDEQELIKKGNVDAVVERRMKKAMDAINKERDAAFKARDEALANAKTFSDKLGQFSILGSLRATMEKQGIRPHPSATADLENRTLKAWRIEEGTGNAIPIDEKGQKRYGSKGSVMDWDEFVRNDLMASAPHLFVSASGGGSKGSDGVVQTRDGVKIVDRSDERAKSKNIAGIADGSVKVAPRS